MPVFNANIPKEKFTRERKIAIGNALNLSLNKALGIPEADRFVIISEHEEDEFFIHPTFMNMQRTDEAMIITVMIGAHRPLSGVNPDNVFFSFIPVPNENFSFGRGAQPERRCR